MFLYGYHPVREALRHRPHEVARVLVSAARAGHGARRSRRPAGGTGYRSRWCRSGRSRSSPGRPTTAWRPRCGPGRRRRVARDWVDPGLVALLEDVQDPRNLGALLRVCEGAGAGRVLIRDRGSAPVSPTVAKTSAGATEWLEIERITNTANEIERLKAAGFWVYGTDPEGDPPWEVDLSGKVALCFGGEEKGLRARTRQLCDRMIGLPMRGRVGSLNIATSAAAVLYEAVRQRTLRRSKREVKK